MPDAQPKKSRSTQIAALCAAAALVCLPLTKSSEGERLKPYRDPANIITWCYGETQGLRKDSYTSDECARLLENRLASVYAPKIAECLPQVVEQQRIKVFAALLDASYNAGPSAVCSSRMARSVRAGQWSEACDGFFGWYTTTRYRGKVKIAAAMQAAGWRWVSGAWRKQLPGLVTRRGEEARLCRAGIQ